MNPQKSFGTAGDRTDFFCSESSPAKKALTASMSLAIESNR
jgi:hypothetical protein